MTPDTRRLVAVAAHLQRVGACPRVIHSLGTGETERIEPTDDGFVDLASGRRAALRGEGLEVTGLAAPIILSAEDDVAFAGFDPESGEYFSGRSGGGATVTIYERDGNFFQYAVASA